MNNKKKTIPESISEWENLGNKFIKKTFKFPDFKNALNFVNKIAEIAEQEQHHPDIKIHDYNKVEVKSTTHDKGKLTQKDFKLAKKIDKHENKD